MKKAADAGDVRCVAILAVIALTPYRKSYGRQLNHKNATLENADGTVKTAVERDVTVKTAVVTDETEKQAESVADAKDAIENQAESEGAMLETKAEADILKGAVRIATVETAATSVITSIVAVMTHGIAGTKTQKNGEVVTTKS